MNVAAHRSVDCVVVGAGVIGLAVADALLRRGRRVAVLERDRPGAGATRTSAGMLAPEFESDVEHPELTRLGRDSLERYADFVGTLEQDSGVACGYETRGTLCVGARRDDRSELTRLAAHLGARGLDVERLDPDALQRAEPHLSSRVSGGWRIRGDHQVDPRRLVAALCTAIRRRGGTVQDGRRVTEVAQRGGAVCEVRGTDADGDPFAVPTEQVIVAAGAWSTRGLRLPVEIPGLRPVKGQLLRLRGRRLLDHVVRAPDVYLVPRADGELLVGATVEEMGFDTTPTAGATMDLLRLAWDILPGIYDLELAEISVGLRPAVDDHLPLIGSTAVRGLSLALGHYRNGILLAPATAHYLAEMLDAGRVPAALQAFDPSRRRARAQSGGVA